MGVWQKSRCFSLLFSAVLMYGLLHVSPALQAGSSKASHSVTVEVPTELSLTSPVSSFTLTYQDHTAGSETNIQSVTYTARANCLASSARVEIKVPAVIPGMDFKAEGQPYSKVSGSSSLVPSKPGYRTIGTSPVKIYDHRIDSGTGKTTRGTFVIDYKMTATEDLDEGSYDLSAPTVVLCAT